MSKGKWKTKEGVELKICDMETSHIKNCINMLLRAKVDEWGVNGYEEKYGYGGYTSSLIEEHNRKIDKKISEFKKELLNR